MVAGRCPGLRRPVLVLYVPLLPALLLHADAAAQPQQCDVADVHHGSADLRSSAVRSRQRDRRAGHRVAGGGRRLPPDDRRRANPRRVLADAAHPDLRADRFLGPCLRRQRHRAGEAQGGRFVGQPGCPRVPHAVDRHPFRGRRLRAAAGPASGIIHPRQAHRVTPARAPAHHLGQLGHRLAADQRGAASPRRSDARSCTA